MPVVTPQWLMNFESRMQLIVENEYLRLLAAEETWWDAITKIRPSQTARELISWIVNGAYLEETTGTDVDFEDPDMLTTEWTVGDAGKGLKLRRKQFEDLDGNGVDIATDWAAQMGAQHGYWPQRQVAKLLKEGEAGKTYDGLPFFHAAHFTNGRDASNGTFANLLTGSGYGIHGGDDVVALQNLAKVYAVARKYKMPNGKDPRMLRPAGILCGPALAPQAWRLLNSKFFAGTGIGSSDFTGFTSRMGYGKVIEAPELTEAEYDSSYYVILEQLGTSKVGALVYVDREPFNIRYHTGRGGGVGANLALDIGDQLAWVSSGRNVAGYGHPFLLLKVKPSA